MGAMFCPGTAQGGGKSRTRRRRTRTAGGGEEEKEEAGRCCAWQVHKKINNCNQQNKRRRRTAEGEEEAYVSSVMGAMLCPANRQTWVWLMSWWCDSTGCTYRLGSQLWFMKRATLPSCFASRMYFACLWVSLTSKCNTVSSIRLILVLLLL